MLLLFPLLILADFDIGLSWGLLDLFRDLSLPLHRTCLDLTPDSSWSFATQALVCGSSLPKGEFFDSLKNTSLLHLAIVSGSHLLLLEKILRHILQTIHLHPLLKRSKLIKHFINGSILSSLFLYCLICLWQPPAVRSFFTLIVQLVSNRYKLSYSPLQITWISGIVTWSIFPSWSSSFSFLLSWGASLGLSLYEMTPSKNSIKRFLSQWKTHCLVYLTLVPLLMPLTLPHPLTILCNWLLGPLLGIFLFPMGLLTLLIPPLSQITDIMWSMTAQILLFVSKLIPPINISSVSSKHQLLWIYIFSLQIIFHLIYIKNKRS